MKSCLTIFLFFIIGVNGYAQDSAAHLSIKMFNPTQSIQLNTLNGWRFHVGNNPGWSEYKIDTVGWQRMEPSDVSKNMADKNGRVEGWFRLIISLDSSFTGIPLYVGINERGASDMFIDGKLFQSYGNTGMNGEPFATPVRTAIPFSSRVHLSPGRNHILAIHFVNYVPRFPVNLIESENGTYPLLPFLNNQTFKENVNTYSSKVFIYHIISITVCFVLSLLFWLLAFQNPREKNLRLIALCTTCFGASALIGYIQLYSAFSLTGIIIISCLLSLSYILMVLLILVILAKIFTNSISRKMLIFLNAVSVMGFYSLIKGYIIPVCIVTLIYAATALYYFITSWKNLKGPQWAIVTGVLATLIWIIIWAISKWLDKPFDFTISYRDVLTLTIFLSFPLSLLFYVSFRFKEIIVEVRENARQVVQVTEEKRQQSLNQQKLLEKEVKRQTAHLIETLQNLKSTQAQLIQSEKMASLGELTAGIAHEIQNPLNFVNNFSDVNKELLAELKDEIKKGNKDEANAIADDVIVNEEKINHHGKRADAIVKGMLQHSRQSSGKKEPTDINALCDEYLRLSYHGLRAKDKSFNADFKTDFDETIGRINVVPQDIGRVLLNLFNNAFYAVNEKSQQLSANSYQPLLSVETKRINDKVEIKVTDNGNGIPSNIIDKIFQPFFTTKPTGQGTGLGLSLAYDIITKEHNGTIKVESREGEGTKFIINLPVT